MIMRKLLIITLTAIIVSLIPTSYSSAQDTLLISYQGRLTDDGANLINGTQAMTFTIYDGSGASKWTESHATVQVNDGLFSVILGSQSSLPDSVFNGDDHFLGIAVGDDPEITPRTLLTSAPGAAVSRRVVGDIVTAPGVLQIQTRPSDPTEPTIETVIEAGDQEVDFDIIVSVPDDDDVTPVSIGTNIAEGSSHMVLLTPSGGARVELKTDESSGSPGVTIKSEVSGYPYSGDERLEIDEDGFLMEASAWDASTGDSSWTFVASDTAGAKAEIARKNGSGDSTAVAMQANDSISQIGLISQLSGNRSTVDLGANTSEAGIVIVNTQPTGESSAINMQTTPTQTELALFSGDAVVGHDILLRTTLSGVNVGIGTDDPGNELYVVGDITATGAITELSSLKYKTNINQISGALDKISGLRGVNFDWRSDEYPELKLSSDQQVGLIAEEVEKVIPQLVHADDNGEKSVDYSKLTAVLIEAIKEQQQQIKMLTEKVEKLEKAKISSH